MAHVNWRIKGKHIVCCNCAFGCPCDFNAPPTYGICEGMEAFEIDQGHFGGVKLDGLRYAATFHFPGPAHEGNGIVQAIIDERADQAQREALLTILSGKEQEEGTLFQIFSTLFSVELDPLFLPIEFEFDMERRKARVVVPGVTEARVQPIRNPVTGAEHRARINLPQGFEYRLAEMASGNFKGTGKIAFDYTERHCSLSRASFTPEGLAE